MDLLSLLRTFSSTLYIVGVKRAVGRPVVVAVGKLELNVLLCVLIVLEPTVPMHIGSRPVYQVKQMVKIDVVG